MLMRNVVGAGLLASALLITGGAAYADLLEFNLDNHPDGNAQPPQYGLRLDYEGQINLFHFVDVMGTIDTDTGEFVIMGTALHATGDANDFSGELWDIDATIQLDGSPFSQDVIDDLLATPPPTDFDLITGETEELTLTFLNDDGADNADDFNGPTDWVDHMGFNLDTEHRTTGVLEGFGWLRPVGENHTPEQDWLFIMTPKPQVIEGGGEDEGEPIPEPTSLALLGFGLAGYGLRRARKKQI